MNTVLFILLAGIITGVSTYIAEYESDDKKIVDIIHSNFSKFDKWTADLFTILPLVLLIIILRKDDIIDFIFLYFSALIIRAFIMITTIYPTLKDKKDKLDFFKWDGDNDMMFSGHTVLLIFSLYILFRREKINLIFGVLYAIFTGFLLSVSRTHYTSDIAVSWTVAIFMCISYFSNPKFVKYVRQKLEN